MPRIVREEHTRHYSFYSVLITESNYCSLPAMAALRQLITVPLAILSFLCTFYAVGKLVLFLSVPQEIHIASAWVVNLLDSKSKIDLALPSIFIDTILVVCFILQHSLLRTAFVKSIWAALGLETAERSIYNLATAGTLLVSFLYLFCFCVLYNVLT